MAHNGRKKADEALAVALAGGQTLRCASELVGIGERTAARRWADPAFRTRVSELQHDMVARSLGRLADGMSDAVEVLRKLMSARSDTIRLAAARAVLDFGIKGWDILEIDARVQELERVATLQREKIGNG